MKKCERKGDLPSQKISERLTLRLDLAMFVTSNVSLVKYFRLVETYILLLVQILNKKVEIIFIFYELILFPGN